MERIEDYSDSRQKSWCIHCGRSLWNLETSDDHVPTKSLLRKPRPHNLPVVAICRPCNNGFSRDEQYVVTFLSCVLAGSTDPSVQANASAARALTESPALRASIEKSRKIVSTMDGEERLIWAPDLSRVERVILKNARGHAYYEYGEPMLEQPFSIRQWPLEYLSAEQRRHFEGHNDHAIIAPWPEVGSRMMTRVIEGQDLDGDWVIVQDGNYRYAVDQVGTMRVRSVIHEYLATEVLWDDI